MHLEIIAVMLAELTLVCMYQTLTSYAIPRCLQVVDMCIWPFTILGNAIQALVGFNLLVVRKVR